MKYTIIIAFIMLAACSPKHPYYPDHVADIIAVNTPINHSPISQARCDYMHINCADI